MHWLHADVDPRSGEGFTTERERILALLTTKLPPSIRAPTLLIDSGG